MLLAGDWYNNSQVIDALKNWKMGKRFTSWKSYADPIDYGSKYMHVIASRIFMIMNIRLRRSWEIHHPKKYNNTLV